ncbi:MAG TPA: PEGA domain-containing protein, partial [Thermoanaerobaculia bacterium]|nr:PEGA domain-containing protein [Thermoanaerobaculia bacterium]
MKKALLLAATAGSILLSAAPAAAETDRKDGSVVTAANRRHRGYRSFRSHRRYYRPSFSWGWGPAWGWSPYYRPYFGYGYGYGDRYGYYGRPYGYRPSPDWAALDTDVSPEGAQVYLDGTFIGTADDFDGYPDYLYLKGGRYRLEFRIQGYESKTIEIQSRPGMKLRIDEDLRKVPGSKQYGSYEPAQPEGGVRRFWAKRRNAAEAIEDEDEIYGGRSERERYRDSDRDEDDEDEYRRDDDEDDDDEDREDDEEVRRRSDRRETRSEEWRRGQRAPETGSARDSARLRLRVEPADAVVFLDDRFVGTAQEISSLSRGISLAPGRHTVTVSRPGYKDRSVQIDVDAGETEDLEVSL